MTDLSIRSIRRAQVRLSKGRREMNDSLTKSMSVTHIHRALAELLDGYLKELDESQKDEDSYFREYWESACQTVYDLAAVLNIPLEDEVCRRRPVISDSMIPLEHADVKLTEGA
jgi:hypothetical protein